MCLVSFVLIKIKSHFNFNFKFTFNRSLKTFSVKNAHTYFSLPLHPIVLSIGVCSRSRLSQINVKFRNECEKNLSAVNANDAVLSDVCLTIFAKNQIFLMKQNGTRLEKKTPRETMNMDRKTELKRLL